MIRILHLSDIHLGTQSKACQYRVQLETDLRKELKVERLDYLVISGDIATRSTETEYQAAFDFIDKLMGHYGLDLNRVIVVPGNHDLNWDKSAQAYEYIPKHNFSGNPSDAHILAGDAGILVRNGDRYKERFFYFNELYKQVYKKGYSLDYEYQGVLFPSPISTEPVLFLGLNSCWQIDHYYQKRASISVDAVNIALEQLMETEGYVYVGEKGEVIEPQGNKYEGWLKIVVCHHPITGREMMDDSVMQLLAIHDFQVFLHGHVHEAESGLYKYDDERNIHIIGAGTFGAPAPDQVPGIPLQYNLLEYDPEYRQIIIKTRKKEKPDGAWKSDARWGPSHSPLPYYKVQLK